MSSISPTLKRAGRKTTSQASAAISAAQTSQRRSTSWIAWEQPDPALYSPPARGPQESDAQQGGQKTQGTRSVGKAVTAPSTAAVAGGSQEVSTSGKTVPPSIRAGGSSRLPSSQTRSFSATPSRRPERDTSHKLPTTLLRIPDAPATWPREAGAHPDQTRVRKQRVVHENEGPSSSASSSRDEQPPRKTSAIQRALDRYKGDDKDASFLQLAVSDVTYGLGQLSRHPEASQPRADFEQAISRYMDGVHARGAAQGADKAKQQSPEDGSGKKGQRTGKGCA
ncbi:hypothetical protein F4819DRAFT_503475 [Hypoxylon fuscum]|nr:hypothetical protein F4819DRAFT_503475 [Hypoxylon fuscum]